MSEKKKENGQQNSLINDSLMLTIVTNQGLNQKVNFKISERNTLLPSYSYFPTHLCSPAVTHQATNITEQWFFPCCSCLSQETKSHHFQIDKANNVTQSMSEKGLDGVELNMNMCPVSDEFLFMTLVFIKVKAWRHWQVGCPQFSTVNNNSVLIAYLPLIIALKHLTVSSMTVSVRHQTMLCGKH